jgi:hypothetical protein
MLPVTTHYQKPEANTFCYKTRSESRAKYSLLQNKIREQSQILPVRKQDQKPEPDRPFQKIRSETKAKYSLGRKQDQKAEQNTPC